MSPNYPHHLRGFGYVGLQRYFLTWCTHERSRTFADKAAVDLTTEQILRAARDEMFALLAYCFMPDHVHLLVEGQAETSDCRRFIRRARQFSGYHFGRVMGRRLWQKYGYERVLRDDESTLAIVRYIVNNPVRAGLVQRLEDHPFSGSFVYTMSQMVETLLDGPAEAGPHA
jgi:putative transposase